MPTPCAASATKTPGSPGGGELKRTADPDRKGDMTSTTTKLEELVGSTVTVPTIPTALLEINKVISSPDGSTQEVATIIDRDPALAAKALRLVNSPLFGLKNPVSSISLSCSILGLRTIKNLVVQATVLQTFRNNPHLASFDVDWLWDHSFKTAVAAGLLAKEATVEVGLNADDAYTAGLVHDVGKMVLLQSEPGRFAEALNLSASNNIPLAQAEEALLGFSHAHVGGLLAKYWKLSDDLRVAVMDHHKTKLTPEPSSQGLLVAAANTIAHQVAEGHGGWIGEQRPPEIFESLGVSEDRLAVIREQVALASMGQA